MTSTPNQRARHLDSALVAAQAVGPMQGWKAADIVDAARLFEQYVEGESDGTGAVTFADLAREVRYDDEDWRLQMHVVLIEKIAQSWSTLADDVDVQYVGENERSVLRDMKGKAVFWATATTVDSAHATTELLEIPPTRTAIFESHVNEVDLKGDDLEAVLDSVVADVNIQIGTTLTSIINALVTASGRPREMGTITFVWFGPWTSKEHADGHGSWTFEGSRNYGVALVPK